MTKSLVRRLETVNTQLWQSAIKFEKLRARVSDVETACGDLHIRYDENYQAKAALQAKIGKALRDLSWQMLLMDEKSQELANNIDAIVDDLEDLRN